MILRFRGGESRRKGRTAAGLAVLFPSSRGRRAAVASFRSIRCGQQHRLSGERTLPSSPSAGSMGCWTKRTGRTPGSSRETRSSSTRFARSSTATSTVPNVALRAVAMPARRVFRWPASFGVGDIHCGDQWWRSRRQDVDDRAGPCCSAAAVRREHLWCRPPGG